MHRYARTLTQAHSCACASLRWLTEHKPAECAVPETADYCQGAVAVLVETPAPLWFVTTHLGLQCESYESVQLISFLKSLQLAQDVPLIVTGDFNSVPTSIAVTTMLTATADAWQMCGEGNGFTFNSSSPFERIDYHFIASTTSVDIQCNATVPVTEASDHRPVLVEYQF
jgi:endonuclease/exonuclease/phosphatase family metal-dependent hydrolase